MFSIEHKLVFVRIEPKRVMIGTQIVVRDHLRVQVTSIQGHHIQQNELRTRDKDHDDLANYQL